MERNEVLHEFNTEILLTIYDSIRYVYPVEKTHCDYQLCKFELQDTKCFEVWQTNSVCKNCISMRALSENRVTMKFEYLNKRIYMVTAIPELKNMRVLELIRDVTDEYLVEGVDSLSEIMMKEKLNTLNRDVITDPLTKLYNRRFLDEHLPYDLVRAYTSKIPISMVMIDIDHFKDINDTFGHPVGDRVLFELATIVKAWIRTGEDWVVRCGGEEFLIYFLNIESELLYNRMESLRLFIQNNVFCKEDVNLSLTVSCGLIHTFITKEEQIKTPYEIIKFADQALYQAKANGRNQCILKILS